MGNNDKSNTAMFMRSGKLVIERRGLCGDLL